MAEAQDTTQLSEGDSGTGAGAGGRYISLAQLQQALAGQSKSGAKVFVQFSDLENPEEGKNRAYIICAHCQCKVLKPGFGKLVEKEVGGIWRIQAVQQRGLFTYVCPFISFSSPSTLKFYCFLLTLVYQLTLSSYLPSIHLSLSLQLFLPSMSDKFNIGAEPSGDRLTKFWLVEDMYHFENIGFSKTVDQTNKYLICADCERGPIGCHDIRNKKELFVAAERVKYCKI